MFLARLLAGCTLACTLTAVHAQGWSPQKNVEIVVANTPGGSNDRTARQLERALTGHKLTSASVTVMNKPGGGGSIATTYVNQHPGDGHYLFVGTPAMLLSQAAGLSKVSYTDLTPIASLLNDYYVFAVNASSPIRTGRDLLERLKKDPQSIAVGLPIAISQNYIGAALLTKAAGGNPKDTKGVVFAGTTEATTALLGGHIQMIVTPPGNIVSHVASGKVRIVGVAAPRRLTGVLADVPTWKEQGVDLIFSGWRAIMGPKGLTPAQVAYWENALRAATRTAEWKEDLEKNFWSDDFAGSAEFRKDLDKDYAAMVSTLSEVGLAKAPPR
jgi:putative tricarboxylic transport membrane protein